MIESPNTSVTRSTNQTAGFTIIEVMIVLLIAGLILLLVFEAIPAITRNSRNNQRKQDITAILQAVGHWQLNNSANLPTDVDLTDPSTGYLTKYGHLSYYSLANIKMNPAPAVSSVTDIEAVDVYNYEKCDPNNIGHDTSSGADYNDVVALYAVETGSGTVGGPQCEEL